MWHLQLLGLDVSLYLFFCLSIPPPFLAALITIAWLSSKQSMKRKAISIPKKSHVCPLPEACSDPVVRHPSEAEWIRAQGCCLSPPLLWALWALLDVSLTTV